MQPGGFSLIEREESAQRLALAWTPELAAIRNEHRRRLEWSVRAGVDLAEVYRWAPVLLTSGIIYADGSIDPQLSRFVQTAVLSRLGLRRTARSRPPNS
jgi:hypothetical protein